MGLLVRVTVRGCYFVERGDPLGSDLSLRFEEKSKLAALLFRFLAGAISARDLFLIDHDIPSRR